MVLRDRIEFYCQFLLLFIINHLVLLEVEKCYIGMASFCYIFGQPIYSMSRICSR